MKNLSRILYLAALMFTGTASSQPLAPSISAPVESAFQRLLAAPAVKSALAAIEADDERTLRDQIELTEIPAPPFKRSEERRVGKEC